MLTCFDLQLQPIKEMTYTNSTEVIITSDSNDHNNNESNFSDSFSPAFSL
jgi:hypothetical protein